MKPTLPQNPMFSPPKIRRRPGFKALLQGATLAVATLTGFWASKAQAATTYYFHVNGTASGYGVTANSNYNWDATSPFYWATASTAAPTLTWQAGGFARFNSTGNSPYTLTVNSPVSLAGFYQGGSLVTLNINATGSGYLNIQPNNDATLADSLAQGVFPGYVVNVNAPIGGSGGLYPQYVSGVGGQSFLYLNSSNFYSGGTLLQNTSVLTWFNNNNAFGTGPIYIGNTAGGVAPILSLGGATITLPNTFTNCTSGSGINFANGANTPVVSTGNWGLGANNLQLKNNGDATAPLTLSGVISGTANVTLLGNNLGTIFFTGANTYSGQTIIAGNGGITLKVASLNKVSGGSPASNLGAPTTPANGTIAIGAVANTTNTLAYTGAGETTDRIINLAGTTGTAVLQNDGTGALTFTSAFTATGAGAKTLTLQGSQNGANTISGAIVDNSSANPTAVAKSGTGKWVLAGANTYTGGTTVNQGTLEISGSVVGNVTNLSGVLTLDNASALAPSANFAVNSGSTVNLNFTGTNGVNALIIDGSSMPAGGVWGAPGSTAPNQNSIFAGTTGFIKVLGKPVITQQPVGGTVFPDGNFTFNVSADGDQGSMTYQWKHYGTNLPNANGPSLFLSPVEAADAGTYSVALTNAAGFALSSNATLTVLGTNYYTQTIRADNPMAYWRLDETNGTLAYDAVGGYLGQYHNVLFNQAGFSLTDSDPGIGLPGTSAGRGYVMVTNSSSFAFPAGQPFTLEAWAYFTNLTGVQRLYSTLSFSGGLGWGFGINGANALRFTVGGVADVDQPISPALVAGVWYHLACSSDGGTYHFYVNGVEQGTGQPISTPVAGTLQSLFLGCNPLGWTNNAAGDPLGEQVKGRLDEMAIYPYLSSDQVSNHYVARYVGSPIVPAAPVAAPPTNYQSLSITLQENAGGDSLSYQWYKAPSTMINGATASTLTLSALKVSDAGSYYVAVKNPGSQWTNSTATYIEVLPIPTSASQLNLTNGLVLHLPFDGDYKDISGRNNNGTNVGATTFKLDGAVGKALHYSTDPSVPTTNYVTLGVPADLQFGASTDFTVAYWVRQDANSTYTNLPFIANEPVGAGTGWMFAPYAVAGGGGGWSEAIGTMNSPSAFTSFPDLNLINDGNWHHLVHSATRTANVITYLDGTQVDSQAIGFLGSISTTTPVNIGQDSTGGYAVQAAADIDDVGVWKRALSPLEVSGVYLAGRSNLVSFAPVVVPAPVPVALQVQPASGGQWQLTWSGTGGTLQAAGTVTGPYTNVVPTATSPYTLPTGSAAQLFYRLKY